MNNTPTIRRQKPQTFDWIYLESVEDDFLLGKSQDSSCDVWDEEEEE